MESAVRMFISILCDKKAGEENGRRYHTWLNGTGSLIGTSRDVLSNLASGG